MNFIRCGDSKIEIVYCNMINTVFPRHTHINHYIIGYIFKGNIFIKTDTEIKECQENECFCIVQNVAHAIVPETEQYSMLSISIEENILLYSELEEVIVTINLLCKKILSEHNYEVNRVLIEDLLISLKSQITGIISEFDDMSEHLAKIIIEYSENPMSIDDMSKQISVSPYHMIRTFKNKLGLSPHQFQLQARLRKAKVLLDRGMNVVDIAMQLGFCDQSHFDKCFKKFNGITPNEYKTNKK